MFHRSIAVDAELASKHLTEAIKTPMRDLRENFAGLGEWNAANINTAVQATVKKHAIKMPALAIPVRVAVFGVTQTPSLDKVLELAGKNKVMERLRAVC